MSGRKTDRLDRMRKMLMTENGITIREFAGKLDVSEITVRRDLKLLEKQGCLRLVNGVAIYHAAEKTALYPEYNWYFRRKRRGLEDGRLLLLKQMT